MFFRVMQRRKHKWLLITLKILASFVVIFIGACFIFDQLVQFRMSDQALQQFFLKNNINGHIQYYTTYGRRLRYITIGNDSLPALLFIHGSPSSLSIYNDFYKDTAFQHRFTMYAVDRPGYGYSGFGKPEPSLLKQAAMIRPLLDSLHHAKHPVIVMGGSYGTSVACRLAIDYPSLVDGLVLIGPSLAPGEETMFWFTPAIEKPILQWFIPRMFQSANTEKLAHKAELQKMLPYWKNIRIPVMYLQGEQDELIDTSNASFAKHHLIHAPLLQITFFKDRPHFIAFSEQPAIKASILKMYDWLNSEKKK